ncbi:MAG TPA: LL-diaminopimelate aminotransferase [Myxococcota bacterium]|nr:LL-diaminopimelate aminotransferase [Myxococcota bacterium]HRY96746.1 LL-diaminopimelate aminotransferase [Myxococcota bacterium]
MAVRLARRMSELAPYLFADLDRKKQAALAKGVDVITFTIGDPDLPTPPEIVAAGQAALADPLNHRYPAYAGAKVFRQAAADFMLRRFGARFDPDREVLALIGTKEGIAHLPLALLDPGDAILCPEPGYPVYAIGARLLGAVPYQMPLLPQNGFLPDLEAVPAEVLGRAKGLWLNYPNNPTGAVADLDFLTRAVAFAQRHDLVLLSDNAYSEIAFDGYRSPSVFDVPGGREVAVEFHSLSKTYNMCGWRVGWAVGRSDLIKPFSDLKSNLDSGVFTAVQAAGVKALSLWPGPLEGICAEYRRRRDSLVEGLRAAGYQPPVPRATFYVWMPVPGGDDRAFATELLERVGVLVTPGSGFGASGRGFVRFSLTQPTARIAEAVARLKKLGAG